MQLICNLDVIHECKSWYRLWFNDTLITEKKLAFNNGYYDGIFFGVDADLHNMHCIKFELLSDVYNVTIKELIVNNESKYSNTSPLILKEWKYNFKL